MNRALPLAAIALAALAGAFALLLHGGRVPALGGERALAGQPLPALALAAPSPQLVRPRGAVGVRASVFCPDGCEARVGGRVLLGAGRGRALRLRAETVAVQAGGERALRLGLPGPRAKRLRRALARGRRVETELRARVPAMGEPFAEATAEARLRPAFALTAARVGPKLALFDGKRPARLRFRFQAPGPTDLRVRVVRRNTGRAVWGRLLRGARPFRRHEVRWRGLTRRGKAAPDGRYAFTVAPAGGRAWRPGSFRLRGFVFPVAGPTGLRGPVGAFGAPRNGGRTHEGLDITAPCGRRVLAARGGKVRAVRYEPALKGHFAVIRDRTTGTDYVYSHFPARSPLREGGRVRTGELVGRVGQSGNAAGTPCHLHFEIWPRGWGRGRPVDPLPRVRGWLRR
ncbi:MAG TPA: M23 family metallopeptidase [Solirubrobacterales bacterium]